MNRRHLLQLGVGVTTLGLSGCLSGSPPELRVKNLSESAQTIHVRVSQQNEDLLSKSFSVPSKADGEEQGTVEDVYPGPGTYTITGEIAGGVTKTEEIELAEGSRELTHVMVNSDETLSVGRMSP
jgi:hypothetical protein